MGRGPQDIHAHLLGDLLVVRLQTLPAEKGRDLLKQVRPQLVETARPVLEALVQRVTGVEALSLHHDVSTSPVRRPPLHPRRVAPRPGSQAEMAPPRVPGGPGGRRAPRGGPRPRPPTAGFMPKERGASAAVKRLVAMGRAASISRLDPITNQGRSVCDRFGNRERRLSLRSRIVNLVPPPSRAWEGTAGATRRRYQDGGRARRRQARGVRETYDLHPSGKPASGAHLTPLHRPTCGPGCAPDSRPVDAGSTHRPARIVAPRDPGPGPGRLDVGANPAGLPWPCPHTRRCR
jgi:Na+-translocating membrane potential-generating system (MpsC)